MSAASMRVALIVAMLSAWGAYAQDVANEAYQKPYDYFVFVRQWSGSFCRTEDSCPLVHRDGYHFTIHGLWPEYNNGQWPQFCNKDEPFDEDKLKDIIEELEEEWPSFMKENDGFWAHEWLKHGTCAEDIMTDEHDYFKTILHLHVEYDLAEILEEKGIVPSNSKDYSTDEIMAAIKARTAREPKVHCNNNGDLTEVWMCMGKDLRPIDCPQHETPRCDHVKIPKLAGDDNEVAGGGAVEAAMSDEVGAVDPSGSDGHNQHMAVGGYALVFLMAAVMFVAVAGFMYTQQLLTSRADAEADRGFSQGLLKEREAGFGNVL